MEWKQLACNKTSVQSNTVSIMGEDVEVVEGYTFLRVNQENRLKWRLNSEAVYKRQTVRA